MKADPFLQLRLLDVQTLDARLDLLQHQLTHLPEDAQLAESAERRQALDGRVRDLRIEVSDLTTEQKRADRDVEQVRARRDRDRSRMDSGAITQARDLERMQHELVSLDKRIGDLEDVELEVMERLEQAQSALTESESELATAGGVAEELTRARDARAEEIGAEVEEVRRERAQTAEGIPADLTALYEKLRAGKGGVGAALLRARECGGCRLTLDSAVLASIAKAPSDEVVRCEECSRILVRTGESGL